MTEEDMRDERWHQRFFRYWQEPFGGDTEEDSMSDEQWYENYWKNASIGDPSYDNVRRTHTPSRLKCLVWTVLLSTSFGAFMWGCDYLASKVNPQHPHYNHSRR